MHRNPFIFILCTFCILAFGSLYPSARIYAQDMLPPACPQLLPGVTLIYENIDLRLKERLELTVLDKWEGGITWRYTYYDDNGHLDAEGLDTQTALDTCRSVASWMIPEGQYDDSCDFFISPTQLRELMSNGETYFRTMRSSEAPPVRLESPETILYTFTNQNETVRVEAVHAHTTRHETMVILKDPQCPLLLSSTDAHFRLSRIIAKNKIND